MKKLILFFLSLIELKPKTKDRFKSAGIKLKSSFYPNGRIDRNKNHIYEER